MVDEEDNLFIVDFGFSKNNYANNSTISVLGTPMYISPEL
jgi:serine/threonine protein kinase